MGRKRNHCALLVGMQIGIVTVEESMEVPQNIKNRNTISSNNSTAGYLPKENKNTHLKRYMYLYVYSSIIYNSQGMEAAPMSIQRGMDKDVVHV